MDKKKQRLMFPACSCMTLTSKKGNPYWFRTCDIGENLWQEGAHIVQYGRKSLIEYGEGKTEESRYGFLGITYNKMDNWLLDGVNEEGLCGGLLMLYEGNSVEKPEDGRKGYVGMEVVTKILSSCKDVNAVKELAGEIQVLDIPWGREKVPATMHYFFVDAAGDEVILEAVEEKNKGILYCYEKKDGIGIMTNSPPYDLQLQNLSWFLANSPEMKQGRNGQAIRELFFDGRKVEARKEAEHISLSGDFPATFAAYDRFLRLAVVKALNDSGNAFEDDEMLALGSGMMNVVMEPDTGGIFHYRQRREDGSIVGQKKSHTQYIVMYDLMEKCFYIRPFDMVSWKKYQWKKLTNGEKEIYEISHRRMQGVITENGKCN